MNLMPVCERLPMRLIRLLLRVYSRQTTYTAQSEYPASTCASARMAQGGESKMISSATSRRELMSSAILSVRKSSAALSAVVLPLITKRLSTGWLIMSASSAVPLRYSTNPAGLSPRKSPIVAGLRTSQLFYPRRERSSQTK